MADEASVKSVAGSETTPVEFEIMRCTTMTGITGLKAGILTCSTVFVLKLPGILAQLGLSNAAISYIALLSPLVKFTVAPAAAVIADRTGARIPFIIGGCICLMFSLILLGFADDLSSQDEDNVGTSINATDDESTFRDNGAIGISIFCYFVFECGYIASNFQFHTTVVELAPYEQPRINSFVGILASVGLSVGFVLGSIGWSDFLSFLETDGSSSFFADVRGTFLAAVIFLAVYMYVYLRTYKVYAIGADIQASAADEASKIANLDENEVDPDLMKEAGAPTLVENDKSAEENHRVNIFSPRELLDVPPSMRGAFVIRFFAAVAWENFIGLIALYLATDIYGGDPDDTLDEDDPGAVAYRKGQLYAAQVLLASQVAAMVFSLFVPRILRKYGMRNTYTVMEVMQLVLMIGITITEDKYVAGILAIFGGIPYAGSIILPVIVVGNEIARSPELHRDDAGRLMTMIFMSVAFAQIVASVGGGLVMQAYNDEIRASFWASIPFITGAVIACRFVRLDDYDPKNPLATKLIIPAGQDEATALIEAPAKSNPA